MPGFVLNAIDQIKAYGDGKPVEFDDLPLDMDTYDQFSRTIYVATRQLRYGETTTYGSLAATAGFKSSARKTGVALGRNRLPLVIPCHRVLAAAGIGGFSAPGGVTTKLMLLAHEGVRLPSTPELQRSFDF